MSAAQMGLPKIVLSIPRADFAKMCNLYGAILQQDLAGTNDGNGNPIDGPKLLWAMGLRESSGGRNLKPRHEPAYDFGGKYCEHDKLAKYGSAYACSYGPLQIMACNAKGFTPAELAGDPEKGLQAAVARLRVRVLGEQKARTIGEICDCWNTGNDRDSIVPLEYIADVTHKYFYEPIDSFEAAQ